MSPRVSREPQSPRATRREDPLAARTAEAGPLGVFSQLARASLLLDALQQECLEPYDLSFVDYSILRVLHLSPPAYQVSPSRLAVSVVRSTGGMTKIIDRLERRGLVRRVDDPADRRGRLVELTEDGLEISQKASRAYTVGRQRVLAALSDRQLAATDTGIRRLVKALDDDRQAVEGLQEP